VSLAPLYLVDVVDNQIICLKSFDKSAELNPAQFPEQPVQYVLQPVEQSEQPLVLLISIELDDVPCPWHESLHPVVQLL